MIIKEFYATRADGVELYKTYSDKSLRIKQNETGNIFDEAIDVSDSTFTYSETDEYIESEFATDEDYEAALSDLGVKL